MDKSVKPEQTVTAITSVTAVTSVSRHFGDLPDLRSDHGKQYSLMALVTIAICGINVTIDAVGCLKTIANTISNKGGEYVLALKNNQSTLHEEVGRVFEQAKREGWKDHGHDTHTEWDKGHGRIERRTATITWDVQWLFNTSGFAAMRCLVEMERERIVDGVSTVTEHPFISSVNTRKAGHGPPPTHFHGIGAALPTKWWRK